MTLRLPLVPLAVLVALVAVAACGTDDGDGAPIPDPDPPPTTAPPTTVPAPELDGREFVSTSVEGHQLADGTTIRLAFDDGSLSANAGCNTIFGDYRITDGTLGVDQLGSTEMACEVDLMAQDRWLTDILTLEPRVELDDATLTLRGVAGTVIVLVDRSEAEPDVSLQGTRWVLDGIRDGDAVSTVPVTAAITFDGDTVTVEAGCNRGSADVTIDDETITFGPIGLTRMMCEPDVMDVEAAVTRVLDGEVRYRIDGDRLTVDTIDTAVDTPVVGDPDPDEPAEMGGEGLLFVATTTA